MSGHLMSQKFIRINVMFVCACASGVFSDNNRIQLDSNNKSNNTTLGKHTVFRN